MKHPVKNTAKNFCWPSSATTAGVADRQDNPLASQRNSPRGRLELPVPRAPGEDPSYGAPPAKCLLTFHQRPELEKHRGSNYPHEGVPGRTRNSWCRGWRSAHCPLSTVLSTVSKPYALARPRGSNYPHQAHSGRTREPANLPGVTCFLPGTPGTNGQIGLQPAPALNSLSPVAPGTSANLPGTPGTNESQDVRQRPGHAIAPSLNPL